MLKFLKSLFGAKKGEETVNNTPAEDNAAVSMEQSEVVSEAPVAEASEDLGSGVSSEESSASEAQEGSSEETVSEEVATPSEEEVVEETSEEVSEESEDDKETV